MILKNLKALDKEIQKATKAINGSNVVTLGGYGPTAGHTGLWSDVNQDSDVYPSQPLCYSSLAFFLTKLSTIEELWKLKKRFKDDSVRYAAVPSDSSGAL